MVYWQAREEHTTASYGLSHGCAPGRARFAIHDGYLFTLGLGEAADASSAVVLQAMAELPPVKRVALIGDALPFDGRSRRNDLLDGMLDDLHDAELLLVVAPTAAWGLSGRLLALLDRSTELLSTTALRGLIGCGLFVGPGATLAAAQFQHWADKGELVNQVMTAETITATLISQYIAAAQQSYQKASRLLPARRKVSGHL